MVKLLCKNLKLLVDILWFAGFMLIVSISLFITNKIFMALSSLSFVSKYAACAVSIYAFINVYILVSGLLFRIIVPKAQEGHYSSSSKQYLYWRLNWHFYSYVFLFFRQYLYYTPFMRFILLRLFRVSLKYSTYIAETANFQDCNNLITIGAHSGVGSEVLLATHLALSPSVSIQRKLTIGSNSHIQARACLAPGITVGDNTIIGFGTQLSTGVKVGNNTRIGSNSIVHSNCVIGSNCRVGQCVIIGEGIALADNTIIPDFLQVIKVKDDSGKEISVYDNDNISRLIYSNSIVD